MKNNLKYWKYYSFLLTCFIFCCKSSFCQQNIKVTNLLNHQEFFYQGKTAKIKLFLKNKDTSFIDNIVAFDSIGLNLLNNNQITFNQIKSIHLLNFKRKGNSDGVITANLLYFTIMATVTSLVTHYSYSSGFGEFIMLQTSPIWAFVIPIGFNFIIASTNSKIVLNNINMLSFENNE